MSQEAQLGLENSLSRRYEALFRVAQAVAAYRDPKELFGASETMWTSFAAAWDASILLIKALGGWNVSELPKQASGN